VLEPPLAPDVLDRATGALLGQALGDALGVPYEFGTPPGPQEWPELRGGGLGPYAPGEWSDDTQMTACLVRVAARGGRLRTEAELDAVAAAFVAWRSGGASDIGVQTAAVIDRAAGGDGGPAERMRAAAWQVFADTGRAAGNGALMRTAVVGLLALDDRRATAVAARAVAELTHADPLAAESCVLWSEAVRVAVVEGRLDLRGGLDLLAPERAAAWSGWIDDAERTSPDADLTGNGFTVTALQAAWHVLHDLHDVHRRPGPDEALARLAAAIRIGGDTDTVAAITGGLLGALVGVTALPMPLLRQVHGWPGWDGRELGGWARVIAQGGPGRAGIPGTQTCPLCGTSGTPNPRYPDHVCGWCAAWVTDEDGRPVDLFNASFAGGYLARYPNGSPASAQVAAGRVWIGGEPLRAGEARFGGIVVQRQEETR